MTNETMQVIAYASYTGEEKPRILVIQGKRINVDEILDMWVEEAVYNRARKRFFRVKGSDGLTRTLYYDETLSQWFSVQENETR